MYCAFMTMRRDNHDGYKKIRERTHQQSSTRDEKARQLIKKLRAKRALRGLDIRSTPLVSIRMKKLPKAYDYK